MATNSDIESSVSQSLRGSPYECTKLEILSGGVANFTYKGTLATPLPSGEREVIVKHAKPYVAQHVDFKFDLRRSYYEHLMLSALSALPSTSLSNVTVTTPHLHRFLDSSSSSTLILAAFPPALASPSASSPPAAAAAADLKTYLLRTAISPANAVRVGRALGRWAAGFHAWGRAPEQAALRAAIAGNRAMRDMKLEINHGRIVPRIAAFPALLEEARAVFEAVERRAREEHAAGDGHDVLIHGDFWSGNVLLPDAPIPSADSPLPLLVIDFELAQLSSSSSAAPDLGQLVAELFQLTHYRSLACGAQLVEAFLSAYGQLDGQLRARTLMHVGVHFLAWGTSVPGWGSDAQRAELALLGRELVVGAWEGDDAKLAGSPVGRLFYR